MSIESCQAFFQKIYESDTMKQQMKAMTDTKEIVAIGKSYGYIFDAQDIVAATTSLQASHAPAKNTSPAPASVVTATRSKLFHYDFDMDRIPGFGSVVSALENLKIKPPTVDYRLYEQSFREDDFQFTSMSPADPEFQQRYKEVMQSHWQQSIAEHDFSRRDFHLINLDQHTDHELYNSYLQNKMRVISALEAFFGSEIRFSGSLWYPPSAYRLWHTNETQAGWRMYLIDFDEPTQKDDKGASFFRYMNPQSKEIVTLEERPKQARFFKVEQEQDKLFWHCIVNATTRNRWSFGFAVPDSWMEKFPGIV